MWGRPTRPDRASRCRRATNVIVREYLRQLRAKGLSYWIRLGVLLAIGGFLGHWLGEKDIWIDLRYKIYQAQQRFTARPARAERTVLVLIQDEEYWKGKLGRRVPIKRDYLADLVLALTAANPAVIALDFDLSSPTPKGDPAEHPDYQAETKTLLEAVKKASQRTKIVLPRTVDFDEQHHYVSLSDIHDGFVFGPSKKNIYEGYIALPYDIRRVPGSLEVKGAKSSVDSLALAIVKAYDEAALKRVPKSDSLPFGSYLAAAEFRQLSSRDVLKRRREVLDQLAHKIVIVGGAWHKQGYERGELIDTYNTPVDWIGGAFIHANYVEALLDGRAYKALPEWIVELLVALLVIAGAIIFALEIRPSTKGLTAAVLSVSLILVSYFFLQNLGLFFDFFIPLLVVAAHFTIEKILEWREEALEYRAHQEVR